MTEVRVFPDADALGATLAREILDGIDAARSEGRRFVLGCPGGRSARSTYQALARQVSGADLGHLVIAMMDDYIEPGPDGTWQHVPADAHFSCRRFAAEEIVAPLDAAAAVGIAPGHVWLPDPADPAAYADQLAAAGGVDHFIVASGASDGHVAFVKPGMALDGGVSVIPLAESTRRDNMATFPAFRALEEVPDHGVSVGLGTIATLSRRVTLVMHGAAKRETARRVLGATAFEPDWPATFIHGCPGASIWLDEAADPRPRPLAGLPYLAAPIRTERLLLRPFAADDLDDVRRYQGRDDVTRFLGWAALDETGAARHLDERVAMTRLEQDDDWLVFAVEPHPPLDTGERVVGEVILILRSAAAAQLEIGWIFDPVVQGRGMATEAAGAVLSLAFTRLGAHRVYAVVDSRNDASARLCERLGMHQEALLREHHILKGELASTATFGLLATEWSGSAGYASKT